MRKRRFIVVGALYAVAIPVIYALFGPVPALIIGSIMIGSVGLALWLARNHEPAAPRPAKPLSDRERRWYSLARRVVLVSAIVSLMVWASVWVFYWELRGYLLAPGVVSCTVAALAVYAVLRPRSLSSSIMRFQMMVAFGYVLAVPLVVGCVLLARTMDYEATSPIILVLVPTMALGILIERWRGRAVVAA